MSEASAFAGLPEFIAARLDEDEAAATACADNDGTLGWRDSPVQASLGDHTIRTAGSRPVARIREADSRGDDDVPRILSPDAVAAHIARYDPARVLRRIEAGRRILARYEDCLARMEDPAYPNAVARDQAREYEDFVLPNLAAEWDDHAGHREEWKP
jgi:hypothetical protein